MSAPHHDYFTDQQAIHGWVQTLGGVAAAARALGIDLRTMERFFSGAMPMKLRLARELAALAGEEI